MTLELVRPAPFYDLLEMVSAEDLPPSARKPGITPQMLARANAQCGRSWGLMLGPRCVACMGLFPTPAREDGTARFEAWFFARSEAAAAMLSLVRVAQLTARVTSEDGPVEIFARVAEGHLPGERLARAIGFRWARNEGGFGIWIWGPNR